MSRALHLAIAATAYNRHMANATNPGRAATPTNVLRLASRPDLRCLMLDYMAAVERGNVDQPLHDVAQISEAFQSI